MSRVVARGTPCLVAVVVLVGAVGAARLAADTTGIVALERFWSAPILRPFTQARYVSSYDRLGANDDGFDGTHSALYVDASGEHVIFDERGPGTLYTLWFTSRVSGWSPLAWGRLRFYFDDETTPRIDLEANDVFAGRQAPFLPPFVFGPFQSTGGHVSYVPLAFQRRLKITTERRAGFYNAYFHSYAADQQVESWTPGDDLDAVAAMWTAPGRPPAPERPGDVVRSGTVAVDGAGMPATGPPVPVRAPLLSWQGAGAVASLRVNPLFPLTQYQLRHLLLRLRWDGEAEPSVDVPIGHFFGSGLGEASVRAVPIGMSESGPYYCYLPMPFWRSMSLELVNEGPDPIPSLWWEVRIRPRQDAGFEQGAAGYFKAAYNQAWPTERGRDYSILETSGRGLYLGQMMTVEPVRPETKRWWEGDLRILIDGRRHPALQGTGHEDEYLGGWSNEWLMNPYSLPLHGEPRTTGLRQVDFQWSAATTVYRFFAGGIPYESSLRVSTEHGTENGATASYSSVAYYYELPSRLARSDVLDVGDPESERRHGYESDPAAEVVSLSSSFEGPLGGETIDDTGRHVTGRSRFTLRIPPDHDGVRLRRLYDQGVAQEAEVRVDGEPAGTWYTAATNAERRWADADFLVPIAMTRGKSSIAIEVRVVRPPWSEYRYETWVITAAGP